MNDINKQEVARRIKKVRKECCKMTQVDFGIALNPELPIRQSTVRQWETGDTIPSTERIIKIAKLGGVTVSWLLFGEDEDNLQNYKLVKTHRTLEMLENILDCCKSDYYEKLDLMLSSVLELQSYG